MTTKSKFLRIIALALTVGAFFIGGTMAALAADTPVAAETLTETLTVDDVWLTGDTLHIAVTDSANGGSQTLELNLSDYAKNGDESVTIQATDSAGRVSNAIRFKNPYYTPASESADTDDESGGNGGNGSSTEDATTGHTDPSESAVSEGKPFTPDGTGSVIDNAESGDGKEFFTVETVDGNVFYLIVDRQRDNENVYLLNAVTEDDLQSLAKPGDGKSESAIPAAVNPPAAPTTPEPTPEPTPAPAAEKSGGNTGMIGIVVVVLIVVGGAGYYLKIVRPKKSGYDYEAEEPEDDAETGEDYAEPREEESFDYDTSDEERKIEESEVDGE
jgi:hypothetical protein